MVALKVVQENGVAGLDNKEHGWSSKGKGGCRESAGENGRDHLIFYFVWVWWSFDHLSTLDSLCR